MLINIYSVFDNKAKIYSQPLFQINDQVAQRIMQNCVDNKEHTYGMNPEDFSLYQIGVYNDLTGTIEPENIKILDLITLTQEQLELEEVTPGDTLKENIKSFEKNSPIKQQAN